MSVIVPFVNVCSLGTGSVKIWQTRHEISVDIRIFFYDVGYQLPTRTC